MYVNLLISVVHAAVEGGFLPNDPNFHESEKFEKHFSCTSTTFACKCSNFDQITLTDFIINHSFYC